MASLVKYNTFSGQVIRQPKQIILKQTAPHAQLIELQICHQIYQNSVIPSKMEGIIQVNDNLLWAWKIFSPVSMSCMKCSELPKKPQIYRSLANIICIFVYWLSLLIAPVTWETQKFLNFLPFTLDAPLSSVISIYNGTHLTFPYTMNQWFKIQENVSALITRICFSFMKP